MSGAAVHAATSACPACLLHATFRQQSGDCRAMERRAARLAAAADALGEGSALAFRGEHDARGLRSVLAELGWSWPPSARRAAASFSSRAGATGASHAPHQARFLEANAREQG